MAQKDEKGHVINTGGGEPDRLLEGHCKGKIKEVPRREMRRTPRQADGLLLLRVSPPPASPLGLQECSELAQRPLGGPSHCQAAGLIEPTDPDLASHNQDFQGPSRPQGRGHFCSDRSRDRRA